MPIAKDSAEAHRWFAASDTRSTLDKFSVRLGVETASEKLTQARRRLDTIVNSLNVEHRSLRDGQFIRAYLREVRRHLQASQELLTEILETRLE